MRRFMEALEASRNTVTRDFEYLRDSLGAPLAYERERNGHWYDPTAPQFELPGFWMNSEELYALLACEQLLESVQPGMITDRLAPLKVKIHHLLGESGHDAERISERIQIQSIQARTAAHQIFNPIAEATLGNKRLSFAYFSRSGPGRTHREADPQRLLHYRSNWYLLAVCRKANALRLFSLDRIFDPQVKDAPSVQVAIEEIDDFAYSSFGIFGGAPKGTAHLRFSRQAAEWVADETWHPDQLGEHLDDGYHLKMPYSDKRELTMEVLRYGPDVEVLGPPELREEVILRIRKMAGIY